MSASSPRDRWSVLSAVLVATGVVFLTTLVREPDWGDGAELVLQAARFGVTHPPGAPVHTWLAGALARSGIEPALAGNLLSTLGAMSAAAALALAVLGLTRRVLPSIAAGLVFAFSPAVWSAAVKAELYDVSAGFLSASVLLLVSREFTGEPGQRPLRPLLAAGALYALAVGAYLADLLLLPGFVLLVIAMRRPKEGRARVRRLLAGTAAFLLPLAASLPAYAAWNAMRSAVHPPIGTEFLPDSLLGWMRFTTGVQYGTTASHPIGFFIRRTAEHAVLFTKGMAGLGIVFGAAGLLELRKRNPGLALALLIMFVAEMGYFTYYRVADYFRMVVPAYLVFAVWVGVGIARLSSSPHGAGRLRARARQAVLAAGLLLPVVLVGHQYGGFRDRSGSRPVTSYARESLACLPPGAIAVTEWNHLAPLLYFQHVRGLRPDIVLLEKQDGTRHYASGTVRGWMDYARRKASEVPVLVDGADGDSVDGFVLEPVPGNPNGWRRFRALR